MSQQPTEYPLAWPYGMKRHGPRKASSQFRTGLSGALKNVRESLTRFGNDSGKPISNLVISSNVTLGISSPEDSGVAVYFTWDGENVAIPVDRYAKVQDNLQAIHHILEARRTELRHGGLQIVRATFAGFKALPAPSDYQHWTYVLAMRPDSSADDIKARVKHLAKLHHPDGGRHPDPEKMKTINAAKAEALAEIAV